MLIVEILQLYGCDNSDNSSNIKRVLKLSTIFVRDFTTEEISRNLFFVTVLVTNGHRNCTPVYSLRRCLLHRFSHTFSRNRASLCYLWFCSIYCWHTTYPTVFHYCACNNMRVRYCLQNSTRIQQWWIQLLVKSTTVCCLISFLLSASLSHME